MPAPTDDGPWLTKAQVAELAGVTVRTVERHIKAGRLGAVRRNGPGGVQGAGGRRKGHYVVWIKATEATTWISGSGIPASPATP